MESWFGSFIEALLPAVSSGFSLNIHELLYWIVLSKTRPQSPAADQWLDFTSLNDTAKRLLGGD